MAPDQWLIKKIAQLFLRRYGYALREEFLSLEKIAERGYFEDVKQSMASCGTDVTLRTGTRIFHPENVHMGSYIALNYGCLVMGQGGVWIGDHCVLGPHTIIATVLHSKDGIYYDNVRRASVKLGKNIWTGSGAILLPGVEIGDNAIIGAGAVVTKSIPANKIALGIPARVVSDVAPNPTVPNGE